MKKKVVSILLILILLSMQLMVVNTYATNQKDLEDQKSDLVDKKNDAENQNSKLKEELDEQMKEISELDLQINESENEIQNMNIQISNLEKSINEKEKEIEQKQKEYDQNQILLEDRLSAIYEMGDTSFLDMLFQSKNIIEFISTYSMMSELAKCDNELLDQIEQQEKAIEESKNNLEKEKVEVEEVKKKEEQVANSLKSTKAQRQAKANALSAEQKEVQAEIDKYNNAIKEVENAIAKAIQDAQNKTQGSNGSGLKFDGSFIWPCNNKIITSTVKRRWGRWHKGIDIGARYENVYAAASGYAYTMENPSGYGHYIMVVHGSGYVTLYGHLNSYKITSGQYVNQGQVIAISGNTGASQGAHLHFEIRKASLSNYFSSNFLNPLDYLPGGYTFAPGATTPS